MERLLIAVGIVLIAVAIAQLIARRSRADAPTQQRQVLPTQLDRADFRRPDAPWLVAIFSSTTCSTCADVVRKAVVLESAEVAIEDVAYQRDRARHERYAIDSVPALLIAGPDGVVRFSTIGPISATDLWAAVAEARSPGSVRPEGGECQGRIAADQGS